MAADAESDKAVKRGKGKAGKKDAQLLIRISSTERDEFIALCDELDTSAAREIRKFIRGFIQDNKSD
ncbi:hypothetical protein [Marinobacter zhejiangensis]|uniref:Uncharacterized protein n=1 Tax=Marinobacter zhejiangensis TaxID=488535 RepID=A0A1I4TLB6_9GAMM|nr:hypothetical protein [Marinobacter zhejiangensis]SFM77532.1 hypothetical protein SAMN04487963_3652 [Marinobacter zhejiangensis]